ncbi:MAG: hypothetical protein ABSH20_24010 [Tepidisphaeraceae bacterium]
MDQKPIVLDYQTPTARPPGSSLQSLLVGLGVLHFIASAVGIAITVKLLGVTIDVAGEPQYDMPRNLHTVLAAICVAFTVATAGLTWLYCCMGIWLCRQRRLKACRIGATITFVVLPFGSLLSVLTTIALHGPGVSALFVGSKDEGA